MKNIEEETIEKFISRLAKSPSLPLDWYKNIVANSMVYKIFFPFAWADAFPEEDYPKAPSSVLEFNKRVAIGNAYFQKDKWETIKAEFLEEKNIEDLFAAFALPFNSNSSLNQLYRKLGKVPIKFQRSIPSEVYALRKLLNFLSPQKAPIKFSPFKINSLINEKNNDAKILPWAEEPIDKYLEWYQTFNEEHEANYPQLPFISFDASKKWYIIKSAQLGAYHFYLVSKDKSIENWLNKEKLSYGKLFIY